MRRPGSRRGGRQLLGAAGLAGQPERQCIDPPAVGVVQLLEGPGITLARPRHKQLGNDPGCWWGLGCGV